MNADNTEMEVMRKIKFAHSLSITEETVAWKLQKIGVVYRSFSGMLFVNEKMLTNPEICDITYTN